MEVKILFQSLLNSLVTFVFGFMSFIINGDRPLAKIPPVRNPLLLESASSLAKKIRSRKLKSLTIVEAYIDRIKEVNGLLNAMVSYRFSEARDEAQQIDEMLDSGQVPERYSEKNAPFLGVPLTVKEAFSVIDQPNTSGLINRKDIVCDRDAPVVDNLRRSGCIILGVTNVSELCMWYESANFVYGRSNNPYDIRRIVGGSSGGEGCILGAAGSVIGIGSDIGGSIRMPAFFNGVFGHKPSPGVVLNSGQFPPASKERSCMLGTGPMCRFAVDLDPMLRVMAGSYGLSKLRLDAPVDLRNLRFFSMGDDVRLNMASALDPELVEAQAQVRTYLQTKLGVTVQRLQLYRLKYTVDMWFSMMSTIDTESFTHMLGNNGPRVYPLWELLKRTVGLSSHTLPAIMLGLIEGLDKLIPERTQRLLAKLGKLREELENILGDDGVLIYPSHPKLAPFHNAPLLYPCNFAPTATFNMLSLPATQVPLGLSAQGLPLGIQVVANRYNDHLTLAVARELEKGFGGWAAPIGMGMYHEAIEHDTT
ncbi:fatty-acid amide hydrolase 2-like [Patiria miniata]|uniref:Amidase domain-containing protein n=1 Tax=Patiria miniata TaxID=46514 RepID=A0A914A5V3_PATMI|nr:fatty-acid amide hydrolase 2-like [Patiria miniata]XP_038059115.1 fatty-acid amide hydrolase 2-like [Patiria miniata]XP_038059116.1 fatty-acid amide hydrolase 2-like [Patiria miniata]